MHDFSTLGVGGLVYAALASLATAGCSAQADESVEHVADAINNGVRDSTIAAIGYIRQAGKPAPTCSFTLIEPRIGLTAAHCFNLLGNKCVSEAETTVAYEAVLSPKGDDTDRHVYGIRHVAIAPEAYVPAPPDCPGGFYGTLSCAGEKRDPEAGNDIAVFELAEPVPPALVRPIRVITSARDDLAARHGLHANLEDPDGPVLAGRSLPDALIGGWGKNEACDVGRRIGLMDIANQPLPFEWHRSCWQPRDCNYDLVVPDSSTCEQHSSYAPGRYDTWTNALPIDRFLLARKENGGIYDGAQINHGDSGGPLLLWLTLPGEVGFDFYVVGTASRALNDAACGEKLRDGYFTADFSVTFAPNNGTWLETTITSWLNPKLSPGCHRELEGGIRCPPGRSSTPPGLLRGPPDAPGMR